MLRALILKRHLRRFVGTKALGTSFETSAGRAVPSTTRLALSLTFESAQVESSRSRWMPSVACLGTVSEIAEFQAQSLRDGT